MKYWRVQLSEGVDGAASEEISKPSGELPIAVRTRYTNQCGRQQHTQWTVQVEAATAQEAVARAISAHSIVQDLVSTKQGLEPIWREVVKAYMKLDEECLDEWNANEPDWYTELSIRVADLVHLFQRDFRTGLVGIAALAILGIKSMDEKEKKNAADRK